MSESTTKPWSPPFCAKDTGITCPYCDDGHAMAREKTTYFDGDTCEAYCEACHAELEVQVSVEISFSDPECAHSDCGMPGAECGHPRTT